MTRARVRKSSGIGRGASALLLVLLVGLAISCPGKAGDDFMHADLAAGKLAADIHRYFVFYPRYARADCIVRFTTNFNPARDDQRTPDLSWFIYPYLQIHEPAALLSGVLFDGDKPPFVVYYIFRDRCPRRFEIMAKALTELKWKFRGIDAEIDRTPPPRKVIERHGGGTWVDTRDYVFEQWYAMERAADTCDGAAWLAVARNPPAAPLSQEFPWLQYIYYSLALHLGVGDAATEREPREALDRLMRSPPEGSRINTPAVRIQAHKLIDGYIRRKGCPAQGRAN